MEGVAGCFLRPLLHLSKQHLLEYMNARDLDWREDASNQSRKYKRNKVRLDLLPLMEELAGGKGALQRRMQALAAQSRQVKDAMAYAVRTHWMP
jgi:tRNA(Ile)-lysidine synthase